MNVSEHRCESLPEDTVSIFINEDFEPDRWWLCIGQYADEETLLENHLMENVGDTLWQTLIQIKFCPYCGEKLLPESEIFTGDSHHHDFSRW